jgi:mono/diheme cytochrome c family protein
MVPINLAKYSGPSARRFRPGLQRSIEESRVDRPFPTANAGNIFRGIAVHQMWTAANDLDANPAGHVAIAIPGVTADQGKRARSSADGLRVFQHCSGCHSAETSERKVGPSLKELFRKTGTGQRHAA